MNHSAEARNADEEQLITVYIDRQMLGIPVRDVKEILQRQRITSIPLVQKEISGSLNLRGRIVTVIDVRHCLDLPKNSNDKDSIFVVIENKGELYSLTVDSVGDVISIPLEGIEANPPNLASNWRRVASGVHKLDQELLVLLNLTELLNFSKTD